MKGGLAVVVTLLVLAAGVAGDVAAKKAGKRSQKASAERSEHRRSSGAYTIERLDDGITLVHIPSSSSWVSLRYAIRSGGFADPPEKSGLAHLVEHLIFHGTYDIPEGHLFELARRHGAVVNAHTSTVWTTYELDAPKEAFFDLMEPYVTMLTSPALQFASFERERQVVEAEDTYYGIKSLPWALDQLVFPSENRGRTVIGTKQSRAAITVEDAVAFYEEHYTPANTVVVVVGDVAISEVRAVLERTVLQPPVPAREPVVEPLTPNAPAEAKVLGWPTATAAGYHLGDVDPMLCEDIARLLELRVLERVRWDDTLASEAVVQCQRLRGESFVVAYALAKDAFGSRLPDEIQKVMESAVKSPMTKDERRILLTRFQGQRSMERAAPGKLAEAVARRILELDGSVEENLATHFKAPRLDWDEMRPVMQRALGEKRHVLVHLSPYEG